MKKIFALLFVIIIGNQRIIAQCNPAFTSSIAQHHVTFTGTASAPGLIHQWNFGDGFSGYGRVVVHSYDLPGVYQVKHVVYDSLNNCRDSTVQSITLNFTPACHASFHMIYDSVFYENGIYFISNSMFTGTGIRSYTWTVDGVVQGYGYSFHWFPSPGTHQVCLTIVTNAGCTSTYCNSISVPASCNYNPGFFHTADPTNLRRISFTPIPNQSSLYYFWKFGDGITSTARLPVHTYNNAGNYSVKLIVRNLANNCIDSVRQTIVVQGNPSETCTASFTYTLNNYGFANFTATSNQTIISQSWFIYNYQTQDSILINANNPSYQFPDTGYYNVCVTLTTPTGCTRTSCQTIHVMSVTGRQSSTLPAYPNPVTNENVQINLVLPGAGSISIKVYNSFGNMVYESQQPGFNGTNNISIPAMRLNSGQYFVEIIYHNQRRRSIFQKL